MHGQYLTDVKPSPARFLETHRARTLPQFRLRHPSGLYLHMGGGTLTAKKADAYIGFQSQVACIQRSLTLAAQCVREDA